MINKIVLNVIRELSDKYLVKKVLLFGSNLDDTRTAHDIDLAVDGTAPRNFFKYCGDLMLRLSHPVDTINLSEKSRYTVTNYEQ
ncbi:MAG: hypothetical protein A2096_14330 [Spirochaetes bacterium GWF1_41_5]|nr:MAG: hypothetical protein A2096_14330 [Spirochaetes bacterium GWF1_41_5]